MYSLNYIALVAIANAALIPDWNTCNNSSDTCSDGFVCCVGTGDTLTQKTTCRLTNMCSTLPPPSKDIPDWNECKLNADTCATNNFVCCVGLDDVLTQKATCRLNSLCSAPSKAIPDWNSCKLNVDTCISIGFSCCVASEDITTQKATCRLNSMCPTGPPPPAQKYTGIWDNAGNSGAVCVHTVLLPGEKLLCIERSHKGVYPFNRNTNGEVTTEIDLRADDQADGTWNAKFTVVPVDIIPFCGGHSQTADGNILMIGGDVQETNGQKIWGDGHLGRLTYATSDTKQPGSWKVDSDMTSKRWYPSVTTLYNGNQIIVGGVTENIDMDAPVGNNPTYEYYPSKQGGWPRQIDILSWAFPFSLYPTVTQLPSGNVFIMASTKAILLDPATEKIIFKVPDFNAPDHAPPMYPHTPVYTVLPLTIANNYRFVIQVCGGSIASQVNGEKGASNQCWQIAPDEANPRWERQDDMPRARLMPDAVVLPDGKILYVNGASSGTAGGNAGEAQYTNGKIYAANIFDPAAPKGKQWETLASAKIHRFYHSEAILVQSGHVITTGSEMMNYDDYWGGGNNDPNCFPKGLKACTEPFNYMMERFTPPYIQRAKDFGRPEIVSAPAVIDYNTQFDLPLKGSANDVTKVVLVRYSTVTHQINMDQRLIEIPILSRNGNIVRVRSPWSSAIAPPGNWMIWALNKDGVPSESKTVRLNLSFNGKYNFDPTDPNRK